MDYSFQKQQLLYIDALNYSRRFFSDKNFWNLRKPFKKLRKFVQAAKASGYYVECFIDAGIQTEETLKKWKLRREYQVRKCKLDVPPSLALIYGDMWKALKVKVHYSDVDNDDTIAAYAEYHNAIVLSGDKDFYRYYEAQFPIYADYQIDKGLLYLQESEYFEHPKPRELITPLPMTYSQFPTIQRLHKTYNYMKGCPTALLKFTGNLFTMIRELRQSFYTEIGIKGAIFEQLVEWDEAKGEAYWTFDIIKPSDTLRQLLYDHKAAFNHFKPKLVRPKFADDLQWSNHVFGLCSLIFEMISLLNGVPIFQLIEDMYGILIQEGLITEVKYQPKKRVQRIIGETNETTDDVQAIIEVSQNLGSLKLEEEIKIFEQAIQEEKKDNPVVVQKIYRIKQKPVQIRDDSIAKPDDLKTQKSQQQSSYKDKFKQPKYEQKIYKRKDGNTKHDKPIYRPKQPKSEYKWVKKETSQKISVTEQVI